MDNYRFDRTVKNREVREFRFESLGHMTRAFQARDKTAWPAGRGDHDSWNSGWIGDSSLDAVCRKAISGDESLVAEAAKLLDEFSEITPETTRHQCARHVAGVTPDVPAFLAGSPRAMRRRSNMQSDHAPIRIVVNMVSSGAITTEQMRKRGIVILAFLMAASARRAVTLDWAYVTTDSRESRFRKLGVISARIKSDPLDLASAAYAMGGPQIARSIGLFAHAKFVISGFWQSGGCVPSVEATPAIRECLNMTPEDVFIPGAFYEDETIKNPKKWLAEQLTNAGLLGSDDDD